MSEVFIPHPIRGMTLESNHIRAADGWARYIRNFLVTTAGLRVRGPQTLVQSLTQPATDVIVWHDREDDDYLWSDGVIRNAANGTVYTGTISSHPPYEGRFRNQVYLSYPGEATIARNGSTWGVFPFTLDTLTASEIAGSCSYRGRAFFWGTDATDGSQLIEYGGLTNIAGATTVYPMTHLLDGQTILFCEKVMLEDGTSTGEHLAVYCDGGRILLFSGDYPAANNWFLLATFDTTPALSKHAWVCVQGDILVMGEDFIFSTRQLLQGGSKAAQDNAISAPLARLYKQAAVRLKGWMGSGSNPVFPFGFFHKEQNAIIFTMGFAQDVMYSDETDQGILSWGTSETQWKGAGASSFYRRLQFVYSRDQNAFALWDVPQVQFPIRYETISNESIPVWCIGASVLKLDWTNSGGDYDDIVDAGPYTGGDANVPVEYVWTMPWFVERQFQNARITGLRPHLQRQFSADDIILSSIGIIAGGSDFPLGTYHGRFVRDDDAATSNLITNVYDLALESDNGNNVVAPLANVGMQEFFMAPTIRINEMGRNNEPNYDTVPQALEIFGMTVYFEPGGVR